MLEPILEEFGRRVASFSLHPPQLPYVSNLTGTWITAAEATDPAYYVRHLRKPVRFADGMHTLLADATRVLLEVGPGQTLSSLARQQSAPATTRAPMAVSSTRHPKELVDDGQVLLSALGRLWAAGVEINWSALHGQEERRRVPLPTYPFEHQRYWIEPGQSLVAAPSDAKLSLDKMPELDDWFYRPVWDNVCWAPAPLSLVGWAGLSFSIGWGSAKP